MTSLQQFSWLVVCALISLKDALHHSGKHFFSTRERQQSHKSGSLDRCLGLSLTGRTVTAALAGKNLAAIGQKLLQCINILIVNISGSFPAKTTLCLFPDY
jgi:hypothetical protein